MSSTSVTKLFYFYPRSPCGERQSCCLAVRIQVAFLSTLSLRRATLGLPATSLAHREFLSTLSLRRATVAKSYLLSVVVYFYPRSPCGERPMTSETVWVIIVFLSTLSVRRATGLPVAGRIAHRISIHALLAESDRRPGQTAKANKDFYPRSPCGERQMHALIFANLVLFLSTLSLRRATSKKSPLMCFTRHFYPRSPCGERRELV